MGLTVLCLFLAVILWVSHSLYFLPVLKTYLLVCVFLPYKITSEHLRTWMSWARVPNTLKSWSCNWRTKKVSQSQKNILVLPSRRVLHLPFTTPIFISQTIWNHFEEINIIVCLLFTPLTSTTKLLHTQLPTLSRSLGHPTPLYLEFWFQRSCFGLDLNPNKYISQTDKLNKRQTQ